MLDWLDKHGEVFLRKNVGIGRNLQKARLYQKSHETFEGVVHVKFYVVPSSHVEIVEGSSVAQVTPLPPA